MKAANTLIPLLTGLFLFSACTKEVSNKEQLLSSGKTAEKNKKELTSLTSVISSYYEDEYPEWGTTGTNWPAPNTTPSYTPRPDVYLTVDITNSLKGALPPGSAYSPSRYIHLQWRKLMPNGNPASKWYNYHPEIREYHQLRIDTLQNWHPDLNYWPFNINAKALPKGEIEFRARLLLTPLNTNDRASATLWSNYQNRTENYYGYTDNGGNNPQDTSIQVSVSVDLNISLNNHSNKQIDHSIVKAFGKTTTFYYTSSITVRGDFQIKVPLNQPTPQTYSATVEVYSITDKIATQTENFSNTIFINSSAGSSPSAYFKNFSTINIYPAN